MLVSRTARALGVCALALAVARPAAADIFVEGEANGEAINNTIGTAPDITASFTPGAPPTAFPGFATYATVLGNGGGADVDIYCFTTAGGLAIFDIDNDPFQFDTILSLFDADGTLIAFDDDSFPADPGTAFGFDSFLGVIDLAPGTYYVAVTQFANFASGAFSATIFEDLFRPDGEFGGQAVGDAPFGDSSFPDNGVQPDDSLPYQLIIGLGEAPTAIPAPAGLVLLACAAPVLGLRRVLRRKAG
jgi:hypothetical protein